MRVRYFLACLLSLSLLTATSSQGEESKDAPVFNPETVLLSHFTLSRPPEWQWVKTGEHDNNAFTEVIFSAKDPQDENSRAMIFFNLAKPNAQSATLQETAMRWKNWFTEIHTSTPFSPAEKIGSNQVSYMQITGSFLGPQAAKKKGRGHINYALFGAHIEDTKGNVIVRLVGPKKVVEKTKSTLQDMIKEMLQK